VISDEYGNISQVNNVANVCLSQDCVGAKIRNGCDVTALKIKMEIKHRKTKPFRYTVAVPK